MSNDISEYTIVEQPFFEQLIGLGWQHIAGNTIDPMATERQSFNKVLLHQRLYKAIHDINRDEYDQPWLDEQRIHTAIDALERLDSSRLMETNQLATERLIKGTQVEGDPQLHKGKTQTVRFIDYNHPERNDFLVINQFRMDIPGTSHHIIPDLVLFVNGIPLVVVECKKPSVIDPIQEAITQLLRYSNQRTWLQENEGVERLFYYNQLLIATCFYQACVGAIGASYEHFQEWKDTSPIPMYEVASSLGMKDLKSQQMLVAGMLRPAHLLDILQNFTVFQDSGGKVNKIIPRYQQYRATCTAVHRLLTKSTKKQHGEFDQRGGIIWHTQGSGKSLTMVFLVRKMRSTPALRRFKVVVVTDRQDLEKQLSDTARLTSDVVRKAAHIHDLENILREQGADLVFAMIQKYLKRNLDEDQPASAPQPLPEFPELNASEDILVLVDEAHRSQSSDLHANLLKALPNCARIGFTGTPIIMGDSKKTSEIFGELIDSYTIKQSEDDGTTVPIYYEGRSVDAMVEDGKTLDQLFEDAFKDKSLRVREKLKSKYATQANIIQADHLIATKARDMLIYYIDTVMPNGLKAIVVATSRKAAVRYQEALGQAHKELVQHIDQMDGVTSLSPNSPMVEYNGRMQQFLARAYHHRDIIKRLEFATVISNETNDPSVWKKWSNKGQVDSLIERFKKPLIHIDPTRQDGLAFLCVKSMLITGFDAPVAQVLYLDRDMRNHELLQAIARVNRTYSHKNNGLVVDYYGVASNLIAALDAYNSDDIKGTMTSIKDEEPILAARHRRVLTIFQDNSIPNIGDTEACIDLLRNPAIRQDFISKLKIFLTSLEIVLPRPEALPYIRDAKLLGFINKTAKNRYRDLDLELVTGGEKVRELIDQHIRAQGIDPQIPPVSILDPNFEQIVSGHISDKAKASEMEHATRYHIKTHIQEDPVYYDSLSEQLEHILVQYQDNWAALVVALREFTQKVRQGRQNDGTGLDPKTQLPFLGILIKENKNCQPPQSHTELAAITVDMVDHIRQEVKTVDFLRNMRAQEGLRGWIYEYLDDNNVVLFSELDRVADHIMELVKNLYPRLIE